ncbi:hypothetical protein ACFE04_024618 [Oxalis oulophora]
MAVDNCYSDLLCGEDSDCVFSITDDESTDCSSFDLDSPESVTGFMEDERRFVTGVDYLDSLDASAREQSVAWILKVQAYYNFQPLTAYLSVNYLDRFLYSRRLPQTNEWAWQLLSVACLSLAAKMEESLVPSLFNLQVEGAKYVFETKAIHRMELLVLSVLDWRLRSVTPFSFIAFFAWKLDSAGSYTGFLISRATYIILSNLPESSFVEYWPSSIAAAAILCAASEIPILSMVNPEQAETWCDGLCKEKIINCYKLMQGHVLNNNSSTRPPKVIPQVRVTIRTRSLSSIGDCDTSTSSSSSSMPSLINNKRRKLTKCLWDTIRDLERKMVGSFCVELPVIYGDRPVNQGFKLLKLLPLHKP